ncbi:MAG: amylo-alpha-1,6-glucosidase, partial [Thermotogota bacterium]
APSLFSKQVWKKALTSYAQRLFLKWGGISTLSSDHTLFCSEYSGIDDRSYHRGDSWYFINNLAAIAMHRLARQSFSFEVLRIMSATSADILETGFAGHASEVSSAKELQGRGSLAQAWSAGTFIELVTEYFSKN